MEKEKIIEDISRWLEEESSLIYFINENLMQENEKLKEFKIRFIEKMVQEEDLSMLEHIHKTFYEVIENDRIQKWLSTKVQVIVGYPKEEN